MAKKELPAPLLRRFRNPKRVEVRLEAAAQAAGLIREDEPWTEARLRQLLTLLNTDWSADKVIASRMGQGLAGNNANTLIAALARVGSWLAAVRAAEPVDDDAVVRLLEDYWQRGIPNALTFPSAVLAALRPARYVLFTGTVINNLHQFQDEQRFVRRQDAHEYLRICAAAVEVSARLDSHPCLLDLPLFQVEAQAPDLEAALATHDRAAERDFFAEGERERQELLRRFPVDQWPAMTLERYALGQGDSEDTFCRWMEFRSLHLGSIRGGSSRKLIIYKHKDKPGWYFDPEYRDEQEAWQKVRDAFAQAFKSAAANEWNTIDDLAPLQGGPALRLKALHVYFPQEILPIYSQQHLRHFLRLFECPEADDRSLDVVRLNRALLASVRQRPGFNGWTTNEVERFLYRWADPREQRRVVKIAPGDNARFWEDCRREGYICVGWDEVGDLREFESRESFRARFEKEFAGLYNSHKPTLARKANELWTLMELEPGDIVVANKGTAQILAVGEVAEGAYSWRPDRAEYRHTVRVEWDTSYEKEIPPQKKWALATVAPVAAALYDTIVDEAAVIKVPVVQLDPRLRDIAAALERKGQVILYGPAGTGKTYVSRRFAVAWLLQHAGRAAEVKSVLSDPARFSSVERELSAGTGATLTRLTFHPSYSYEDFVEGFRPTPTTDGALCLRLTDGVFKQLCQAAQAQPSKRFLLLIDEINRANLARVFGELITLLEVDKRGLMVTLPQSRSSFCIPPNVYILGTMNTADRSIKLLDAALRRRFAFIELMPNVDLLRGAKVGTLALDDFLEELNRRIAKTEGREKQIGHSFLLDGDEPISDSDEFACRFRQDFLPLLQEYCYDDYGALASYIGGKLVDKDAQMLDQERLADTDTLLAALEEEFGRRDGGVG